MRMSYIWIHYFIHDDDEPYDVYCELDENRLENRRVEYHDNGVCFSYGEERGSFEVLSKTPYPVELRALNVTGEVEVKEISARFFQDIWYAAQERPDGFMGMFV